MLQKLFQVGSSAAVTIPKRSLKGLGFAVGDMVSVHVDEQKKRVTIESSAHTDVVDKELVAWTGRFIDKYRPALEALSQK
jgi:putative addiction module antidote